jgi:hypothetical protein
VLGWRGEGRDADADADDEDEASVLEEDLERQELSPTAPSSRCLLRIN